MTIYKFDRLVIQVSGNAAKFLNGLTSNTRDRPRNAFLNLHGRIIATFDQAQSGADEFLMVLAPAAWEVLRNHIEKFARLNKTTIEPVHLNVYFDLTGKIKMAAGDFTIPQKSGHLIITKRVLEVDVSEEEFAVFRLQHQIPVHGLDYQDEMVLNVDENEFVSFSKGCFLGQEPVAKVRNRSKPTWKLVVRYEDEVPVEDRAKMTSRTSDPKTGRTRGFVFVRNV